MGGRNGHGHDTGLFMSERRTRLGNPGCQQPFSVLRPERVGRGVGEPAEKNSVVKASGVASRFFDMLEWRNGRREARLIKGERHGKV